MASSTLPWSSRSSSSECPPWASSAESGCSSGVDRLWDDVDLAERYLVCSQFEEAVASSTTLLRRLLVLWESEQSTHIGMDDDEMESIMEAAGMVLIQANGESGRLCLQVSAGLCLEAQSFVASFLELWAYKAPNQQFCLYKADLESKNKILKLSSARYMEIVNVYCVQVLTKGLGRLDLALQWVKEADIPAEIQQELYEKLDKVGPTVGRKGEASLISGPNLMRSSLPDSNERSDLWAMEYVGARSGILATKQGTKELDSYASLKGSFLLTPVRNLLSGWTMRSAPYSDSVSRWKSMLAIVCQNKLPFGGAVATFLAIAIYKQRFQLSRLFGGLDKQLRHVLHAIFISLYDFWHLAFNVQLNPLAAVQPLPSTHHRG